MLQAFGVITLLSLHYKLCYEFLTVGAVSGFMSNVVCFAAMDFWFLTAVAGDEFGGDEFGY